MTYCLINLKFLIDLIVLEGRCEQETSQYIQKSSRKEEMDSNTGKGSMGKIDQSKFQKRS